MDAYREHLKTFVYASGTAMKPIFMAAKRGAKKRVAYAEGEEERILRAAQIVVDERIARPTLIGRPAIIAQRVEKFGLRLKEDLPQDDGTQGRYRAHRQDRNAPPPDLDWRHAAAQRPGRWPDLRHLEQHRHPPALHRPGDWPARRQQHLRLHERPAAAGSPGVSGGHPRQLRPQRRATGRDHHHGGRGAGALWHSAQGGAAEPFQLWLQQPAQRHQNAPDPGAAARAGAVAGVGWRDARRRCAGPEAARRHHAQQHLAGQRQSSGAAQYRCGQHQLQPAEDRCGRRHRHWPHLAGRCPAGAYSDIEHHRAAYRQHDGDSSG
ncbi:hypothetical protein FQA39_LY19360 [Lamprigera yunnana]|nr:hypothetical protein FQA39_LY19360 [Lamprigera yunnana]